jgi:hypothetical protein
VGADQHLPFDRGLDQTAPPISEHLAYLWNNISILLFPFLLEKISPVIIMIVVIWRKPSLSPPSTGGKGKYLKGGTYE